jgi:hypothetical protein
LSNPAIDPYLASAIGRALPPDNAIRTGTIFALDGGTVRVLVNGGLIDAGYLASYMPQVGHTVALARQDAGWLVLGSIGGPAMPTDKPAPVPFVDAFWFPCVANITSASATFVPSNGVARTYVRTNPRLKVLIGLWQSCFFSAANNQADHGLRFTASNGTILFEQVLGLSYQSAVTADRTTGGGVALIDASFMPEADTITVTPVIRKAPLSAGSFQRVSPDDHQATLIMEIAS